MNTVHIHEAGRPDGPPLLLTTGLGGAWFDWQPVAELLRDDYRIVAFDRPGLGRSPAGRSAPSLRAETALLESLAERAGEPVFVLAHSVAAFHAEALARIRPDLLAGLVLLDPSCEHDTSGLRMSAAVTPAARLVGKLAAATGLAKVLGPWAYRRVLRGISTRGPAVPRSVVRSVYGRGDVIGTVLAEYVAYREMAADLAALRTRRPFPAIPLVVLTALGDLDTSAEARSWAACHARLAGMSPHGRQVELPGCLHMIQLDRPNAVADAVAVVTGRENRSVS
ncbi:alpha/beta fold hydrolase [Actinomadura sp. HBU206391]|uniref:alpha/beta fold hydrolase n=1 Tax=Actinomadura sp. HBU206391 TaxID=2731692 RepID=UPI0016500ED0|nr:alpha/beta hydrolase [Actinomadura sp. HBU206391]MBC6460095.1 alpha/beta hydrolase [Actinomadura sp. HBU206391]